MEYSLPIWKKWFREESTNLELYIPTYVLFLNVILVGPFFCKVTFTNDKGILIK